MADAELLFKIKADSSQAKAEVTAFRGAVHAEAKNVVEDFAAQTGAAGRLASALGPVGLGFAAVGGAAIAAGGALVGAVNKFVEYAGGIKDLGQESGLTAETLSTLAAYSRLAGKDVGSVTSALEVYGRNLSQVAHGNKALAAEFERVGINAKKARELMRDPDNAARDLFDRLAAITNANERLDAANKLAGKSGKVLASVALEMGGNFAEALKAAREWGIVLSEEDVAAADRFGDAWEVLKMRAEAVIYDIGRGALPELQKAVDDVTGAVGGSGAAWREFGREGGAALGELIRLAKDLGGALSVYLQYRREVQAILQSNTPQEAASRWQDVVLKVPEPGTFMRSPKALADFKKTLSGRYADTVGDVRGGGGRKGGGSRKADDGPLKDIRADESELDADMRRESEAIERDYRRRLDTTAQYVESEIDLLDKWIKAKREIYDREEAEVRRSAKNAEEGERKAREVQQKRTAAEDEYTRRSNAARDKQEEEQRRAKEARADALLKVDQAVARQRIAAIEHTADLGIKRESDAAKEIGDIQLASHDRAAQRLKERLANEKEGSAEYRVIQGEIAEMEVDRATLAEEVAHRITVAKKNEVEAERQRLAELRRLRDAAALEGLEIRGDEIRGAARDDNYQTRKERLSTLRERAENEREVERQRHLQRVSDLGDQAVDNYNQAKTEAERVEALKAYHEQIENEYRRHQQALGTIQAGQDDGEDALDPLRALKDIWRDFKDESENAEDSISSSVESLSNRVAGSLHNMEGAFKQAYVASLLTGEGMGKALKKALAEQLAEISAECTIQGIKHAAYALGSLAFGDFGGAARHAAASAAFFGAAAATGIAASKLAKSAGMYGDSGSGSSAGQAIASEGRETERERREREQGEADRGVIREGRRGGPDPNAPTAAPVFTSPIQVRVIIEDHAKTDPDVMRERTLRFMSDDPRVAEVVADHVAKGLDSRHSSLNDAVHWSVVRAYRDNHMIRDLIRGDY